MQARWGKTWKAKQLCCSPSRLGNQPSRGGTHKPATVAVQDQCSITVYLVLFECLSRLRAFATVHIIARQHLEKSDKVVGDDWCSAIHTNAYALHKYSSEGQHKLAQ